MYTHVYVQCTMYHSQSLSISMSTGYETLSVINMNIFTLCVRIKWPEDILDDFSGILTICETPGEITVDISNVN